MEETFLTRGTPFNPSFPQADAINELYCQLQSNIAVLDQRVGDILTKHEAEFISVYRNHMFIVQKEMRALKHKADDEENRRKKDEMVVKLETERDWFRNEAVKLDEVCKGQG
jgi:hypothetical protein